ncbi:S8 family peptidase [Hymenobacter caeli]|uniref:Subtilisin family serine protease n=1 Tax=Hymenobacter caeli TaxID=2735894 RepID=A0ABX2FN06_9BACT|nr:S8 family peptidase [Hymenobacter caeli]NRT17822.1 subtilisin family serine protease [Hymenobacter caeli]
MHSTSPLLLVACSLLALAGQAQTSLTQWHHLDPAADKVMGISTNRAYEWLRAQGLRPTARPVIVAVVDGGTDTTHADLRAVLWHNPGEVPGNGRDDDHNGYADDLYGWNYLGGADGRNVFFNQAEETRLYARLRPRYEGKTLATVPPAQRAEFRLYERAKRSYTTKRAEHAETYAQFGAVLTQAEASTAALKKALGVAVLDSALLHHPPTADTALVRQAAGYYQELRRPGVRQLPNTDSLLSGLRRYLGSLQDRLAYGYNLTYDPQPLVGDHPADLTERHYGNGNVAGGLGVQGIDHGTHCAGIIAADRGNNLGVQGVAGHVRILSVRAVPNGDERDKDVANAIRYAVDNGAKIISMSFSKYFSPEKATVDEAMRYADAHGVLLVHAAGNDQLNTDSTLQYPTGRYLNGQLIPNLLTVGASAQSNDEHLPASFSNYGRQSVDVFAPGLGIVSTYPGNGYRPMSGTSMATPVVAGIAAVLKTYFPQLTPADLKRLIMASATPVHTQVLRPGTRQLVDFATLSRAGGVVNLYEAVRLASLEPAATATKAMTAPRHEQLKKRALH